MPHYHPAAAPGKPSEKGQHWEQPRTGAGWGWTCPTRHTCCILGVPVVASGGCPGQADPSTGPKISSPLLGGGWKPSRLQRGLVQAPGEGLAPLHAGPRRQPLPGRCDFQADIKKQLGIGSGRLPHSTSCAFYGPCFPRRSAAILSPASSWKSRRRRGEQGSLCAGCCRMGPIPGLLGNLPVGCGISGASGRF